MKEPDTVYPHGLLLCQANLPNLPQEGRFIWQLVGVLDT